MTSLLYTGERRLIIVETPYPHGNVIVEIFASGVCGTDLKTYLHGHPMFKPPTVLGHEGYGRIAEIKDGLQGFRVGDLVAVAPYIECGVCSNCTAGIPELCTHKTCVSSGYFTEYVSINHAHAERALFKIPADSVEYTLVEPLACVLNGIEKAGVHDNVLVVGGGIMGALFAVTLKNLGKDVMVLEISDWRISFLQSR
ncbi:MAG: alcohol dehydrogenase catalytic domain-containing protein, partial [Spirochaetota bacterium]